MDDSVPQDTPKKQCTMCKDFFPATSEYFNLSRTKPGGFHSNCRQCRKESRHRPKTVDLVPEGYKRCTKCKNIHPATTEHFYKCSSPSGLRAECIICHNARGTANYFASIDARKAYSKEYNAVHAEDRKTYRSQYYQQNIQKVSQKHRQYYIEHPEEYKLYRKTHRLQKRAWERNRRARRKAAGGTYTAQDIQEQYQRQKGKCYYCHAKVGSAYHIEHVVPITRGGSNDMSNIVIACPACNMRKQGKLPHEWPEGGRLL